MPDQNDAYRSSGTTTAGTLHTPTAGTDFQPSTALDDAGVDSQPAGQGDTTDSGASFTLSRQSLKHNAQKLQAEAGERARGYADEGKSRAGEALGQVSQLLNDAATQVDDKIGAQYGQYARTAAGQVQAFADQLNAKSVDDLVEDVRGLVRKSPAVAIGAAAALGFVVARVLSAGLDTTDRA